LKKYKERIKKKLIEINKYAFVDKGRAGFLRDSS
jgi:hypothetical protein